MIIEGPYWCIDSRAQGYWIRFINEDNSQFRAQIARPVTLTTQSPSTSTAQTTDWENTDDTRCWTVFYKRGNSQRFAPFYIYRLNNGNLYRAKQLYALPEKKMQGILWIEQFAINTSTFAKIQNSHELELLFKDYQEVTAAIPLYTELPLTPEMIKDYQKQGKAVPLQSLLDEQEQVFIKNLKDNEDLDKAEWQEFIQNKQELIFSKIIRSIKSNSLLPKNAYYQSIASDLRSGEFDCNRYSLPEDYLIQLTETINNPYSPGAQQAKRIASKTDFEREHLNFISNQHNLTIRDRLLELKTKFIFDWFVQIAKHICLRFCLNEPKFNPPTIKALSKQEALTLRNALTAEQIKNAVNTAQQAYKKWYDKEAGTQQRIRIPNGFFTRWRHGRAGQKRALEFSQMINGTENEYVSPEVLFEQIQNFLGARERAYHVHSFASFLIDELRKIKHTPWRAIPALGYKDHYSKKRVQQLKWDNDLDKDASVLIKMLDG